MKTVPCPFLFQDRNKCSLLFYTHKPKRLVLKARCAARLRALLRYTALRQSISSVKCSKSFKFHCLHTFFLKKIIENRHIWQTGQGKVLPRPPLILSVYAHLYRDAAGLSAGTASPAHLPLIKAGLSHPCRPFLFSKTGFGGSEARRAL